MVLILDDLARNVARRVGDKTLRQLPEIKGYIRATVRDLTRLMKEGGVYRTSSEITVTNSEFTLPDKCAAVLAVRGSSTTPFDIQGQREFRSRERHSIQIPTVRIFQDVPYWRGEIVNAGTGTSTVVVDYLIRDAAPAILPEYYEDTIMIGAEFKYHLRHSQGNIDLIREFRNEYETTKNEFKEDQSLNTGEMLRVKSDRELELQNPSSGYRNLYANDRRWL